MNVIRISLDINPPKATAQQKGAFVCGGKVRFFTKSKVREAESFLAQLLEKHRPKKPIEGPVRLEVTWFWPYRKSEKKCVAAAGKPIPHTSRPDLDNVEKGLIDTMTRLQFWRDDAQICQKSTAKYWAPLGKLFIAVGEIEPI